MTARKTPLRHRAALLGVLLGSCAAAQPSVPTAKTPASRAPAQGAEVATPKQLPPGPGPRPDVRFPSIVREQTKSGLELNTVQRTQLPLVQLQLVIRTGSAADPDAMPGLAQLTAAMLKEGTLAHTSAQLAEAIDFLGANLSIDTSSDRTVLSLEALAEHFDQALTLLGEIATTPSFNAAELERLKTRELARLDLRSQNPHFLAARELNKALYGAHPYARIDATKESVTKIKRPDLAAFHATHYAPNNALLIATGAISPEQVLASAERVFRVWAKRPTATAKYAKPPERATREVVVVDRKGSVQSVIYDGNLALPRTSEDFIPLLVANQVLGGSAAARLFMDLREKRSLTYGAYSRVEEREQIAPFTAYASVRNEVTGDAMAAFEQHLQRIVAEAPAAEELTAAKHYLIDRFPLRIETAGKIANLVADLRAYGLPDDYWDHFGPSIEAVTPEQALLAAQTYMQPSKSVIVVVGEAMLIRPVLENYGPVTVVDTTGRLVLKPRAKPRAALTPTVSPEPPPPAALEPAIRKSTSGTEAKPASK